MQWPAQLPLLALAVERLGRLFELLPGRHREHGVEVAIVLLDHPQAPLHQLSAAQATFGKLRSKGFGIHGEQVQRDIGSLGCQAWTLPKAVVEGEHLDEHTTE